MAKRVIFECDVCGAQKQESNNWFLVNLLERAFGKETTFYVMHFFPDVISEHKTACGQQCVTTLLSRWMRLGSLDEPGGTVAQ